MFQFIKDVINELIGPFTDVSWIDDISIDDNDVPQPGATTDSYVEMLRRSDRHG